MQLFLSSSKGESLIALRSWCFLHHPHANIPAMAQSTEDSSHVSLTILEPAPNPSHNHLPDSGSRSVSSH